MRNRLLFATMFAVFSVPFAVQAEVRQLKSVDLPLDANMVTCDPVKVVLPQDRNVRLAPDKILKTKSVGGGYVMQIVETKQGFRYKRLLDANNRSLQKSDKRILAQVSASQDGVAFSEDFESWQDSYGLDWIPEGWQEINEPANTVDLDHNVNNTWYVYYSGGMGFLPMTPDGEKEAFIHFSYDRDDPDNPDNVIAAVDQDEWLITPLISVEEYQDLYFAMAYDYSSCYDSKYLDWGTLIYSQRVTVCNMEVLVQVEGSSEWECILNMEQDYASKMSDMEVFDKGFNYENFKLDLDKYVGKKIKIAFRYIRTGGDFCGNSVCLDAVKVATPATDALYQRPDGTFLVGTSRDFYSASTPLIFGPAYAEVTWQNKSSQYATDFEWQYQTTLEGGMETSQERDLKVVYPWGLAPVPTLQAMAVGSQTTTYKYTGKDFDGNVVDGNILTGGNTVFNFQNIGATQLGVGEYDINLGLAALTAAEGSYYFGSGAYDIFYKTNYGLGTVVSAPYSKYVIESVWIPFYRLSAEPDVEFTLAVYKKNEFGEWEKMATSSCKMSDVKQEAVAGIDPYIMEFTDFKMDGMELALSELEIDTEIMVEVEGFDQAGVKEYCPLNQGENNLVKQTGSFVLQKETFGETVYKYRTNVSDLLVNYYCPFLINFDIIYSFIHADEPVVYFDKNGGNKDVMIDVPFAAENLIVDDFTVPFPEWLSVTLADAEDGKVKLTATVSALSEGETERRFAFDVSAPGADPLKIEVVQTSESSVAGVSQQAVRVVGNGDSWQISYPQGYESVSVVNMSGLELADYQLTESGTFLVPASDFARGVYLLVFNNGDVIKVVK